MCVCVCEHKLDSAGGSPTDGFAGGCSIRWRPDPPVAPGDLTSFWARPNKSLAFASAITLHTTCISQAMFHIFHFLVLQGLGQFHASQGPLVFLVFTYSPVHGKYLKLLDFPLHKKH